MWLVASKGSFVHEVSGVVCRQVLRRHCSSLGRVSCAMRSGGCGRFVAGRPARCRLFPAVVGAVAKSGQRTVRRCSEAGISGSRFWLEPLDPNRLVSLDRRATGSAEECGTDLACQSKEQALRVRFRVLLTGATICSWFHGRYGLRAQQTSGRERGFRCGNPHVLISRLVGATFRRIVRLPSVPPSDFSLASEVVQFAVLPPQFETSF